MKTLQIILKKPIHGYWDGIKNIFDFKLRTIKQDDKGYYRKVDCWEGNRYFTISAGITKSQTDNQSIAVIKRMIKNGYFVNPALIKEYIII